jgi:hypothetical protein
MSYNTEQLKVLSNDPPQVSRKLEGPSAVPSITPSQPGPTPSDARKAGIIEVAVSWLQSLNRLVSQGSPA